MKKSIYQLFPRLFSSRCSGSCIDGSILDNGCGKFADVSDEILSQLRNFGVTDIWLTGVIRHATTTDYSAYGVKSNNPLIVKGNAGSPYSIVDYFDVDPDFACNVNNRMEEFSSLVERIHQQGLKVIIDFVPNHVSREYFSSSGGLGADERMDCFFNANNNFYYLQGEFLHLPAEAYKKGIYTEFCESPAKVTGDDCVTAYPSVNNWYETVKLNYGVDISDGSQHFEPIPRTWHCMRDILMFWLSKNVDGFRCDMAEMVPVEFWKWAIDEVKKSYPKTFFIAEIYKRELYDSYVNYAGFDFLYDKVDLYDNLKSIVRGEANVDLISRSWQKLNGLNNNMLRFLENHDEQRIASPQFSGNPQAAIPAFAVAALMHKGPIMLYNGQEFGENTTGKSGFSGDDGRTTIFDYWYMDTIKRWILSIENEHDSNKLMSESELSLQKQYSEILNYAISNELISEGTFYDLMWINPQLRDSNCYAFFRNIGSKYVVIIANFNPHPVDVTVKLTHHVFDFLGIDKDYAEHNVSIGGYSWTIV